MDYLDKVLIQTTNWSLNLLQASPRLWQAVSKMLVVSVLALFGCLTLVALTVNSGMKFVVRVLKTKKYFNRTPS